MEKAKIIVIGSNSFSGAHYVNFLLEKEHEVLGISRSEEPLDIFLPYKKRTSGSFRFFQYDLNLDFDEIDILIREYQPDFIVNFAAQGMVAESWGNPEHWFQTNVVAHAKLIETMRQLKSLKKYVHISTPEVYGSCEGNVKESENYHPSTPYAVSKVATDMNYMNYFKYQNFPVLFTRAANVYGPSQQLYRIIPKTILTFLRGEKLPLHGGGTSVRSFIHIQDVCEATYLLMTSGKAGEIYHISNHQAVSIRELVQQIAASLNISFNDHVVVTTDRLGKDSHYSLDFEKISQLGWEPKIDLKTGIESVVQWIRSNIDELVGKPLEYVHKP